MLWNAFPGQHLLWQLFFSLFFFNLIFNEIKQHRVGFCHATMWTSHKYTYIRSLLGLPPTHPGHYREPGWVPRALATSTSYYATSVELIPLHCKPLISSIMTIDCFASILFFFFSFFCFWHSFQVRISHNIKSWTRSQSLPF